MPPTVGSFEDNGDAVTPGRSIAVGDILDGELVFTPATNAHSSPYASFIFKVQDDGGVSNGGVDLASTASTITLDVTHVNQAPVSADDSYAANQDKPLSGTSVLANDSDVDGDSLTAVLATGPTHGSLTLNTDGTFTYTPYSGYSGSDSFTYRASDGLSRPFWLPHRSTSHRRRW